MPPCSFSLANPLRNAVDRTTYIEVSAGQKQLVLANSDADAAEKLALMLP